VWLWLACTGAEPSDSAGGDDTAASACATGTDGSTLSCGEVQSCANPVPHAWVERGEALGLRGQEERDDANPSGGGVVLDDLDGDGDLDLVVSYATPTLDLYRWDGDAFVHDTMELSHPGVPSLVDIDGDGERDIALGGGEGQLLRNDGGELTLAGSLGSRGVHWAELAPADLDGDGWTDFYLVTTDPNDEQADDLLAWGDGSFQPRVDEEVVPDSMANRHGFDAILFDHDGDGWQDVYVVNDQGDRFGGNALLRNTGGGLEDVSADCACGIEMGGMGGSVGDYDQDGVADLLLTGTAHTVLLHGQDDGSFVDVTLGIGVDSLTSNDAMGWGSAWFDYDNDGDLDVAVAQGDFTHGHGSGLSMPVDLMAQTDGGFENVGPAVGLPESGSHRAVAPADFNDDGVLDLLVSQAVERPLLYLSEGCSEGSWLVVEAPAGSVVEVEAAGRAWTSWVVQDTGYGASRRPEAWFGLGDTDEVDAVHVRFPGSGGSVSLEGPTPARRRLVARPGSASQ